MQRRGADPFVMFLKEWTETASKRIVGKPSERPSENRVAAGTADSSGQGGRMDVPFKENE